MKDKITRYSMFEVSQYAVLFNENYEVLLLKYVKSNSRIPEKYGFPGGHLEFGEKPIGSLKREIKEELSADVNFLQPILTDVTDKTFGIIYTGEIKLDNIKISKEHEEYIFVKIDKMDELNLVSPKLVEYAKLGLSLIKKQ